MSRTIFERIVAEEIPAEKLFENDHFVVIRDIAPVAPVHLLIIPKKHYRDLQSVPKEDHLLFVQLIAVVQELAEEHDIEKGYRLLTNNGSEAGQSVFHLHFHLIGGKTLCHLV